jgi:hypothetical protein
MEGGNASAVLRQVEIPIVSNETCEQSYPNGITSNMICAGREKRAVRIPARAIAGGR